MIMGCVVFFVVYVYLLFLLFFVALTPYQFSNRMRKTRGPRATHPPLAAEMGGGGWGR